jgi:hypothetical protein
LPVSFISCAFERVDNLGAYRIPSETGLLIPSVYNNHAFPAGIHGQFLMLWAHPEAIQNSTKNQKTINGVPSRNQSARFLNLMNAKIKSTPHKTARSALALMAVSVLAGLTSHGMPNASAATANEAKNSGLKFVVAI